MSGVDIQQKVRNGLRKATIATGSGELVYLVKRTEWRGGTPLCEAMVSEDDVLLKDAIFTSINKGLIDGNNVRSGDRELIVSGDVRLKQNDIIKQGSKRMTVIAVEHKEPSGVLLSQIAQVREI